MASQTIYQIYTKATEINPIALSSSYVPFDSDL